MGDPSWFVLLVLAIVATSVKSRQDVTFMQQPQDTKVVLGTNAFFPCTYTGTRGVPQWLINKTVTHVVSQLPLGHSYNGTGLIVHQVDVSMNATEYQCCFDVYTGQGLFENTCSSSGMLIICAGPPDMPRSINSSLEDQICPDRSVNIMWEPPENVDQRSRYIVTVCEEDTRGDVCPLRKMEKDATNVTVTLKSIRGYLVAVVMENDCGSSSQATLFIPPQESNVCAMATTSTLANTTAVIMTNPVPEGSTVIITAALVPSTVLVIVLTVLVLWIVWKVIHKEKPKNSGAPILRANELMEIVISECVEESAENSKEQPGNTRIQTDTAEEGSRDKFLHMKDEEKTTIYYRTTDKGKRLKCSLLCQFALKDGKLFLTVMNETSKVESSRSTEV